MLLTAICRSIAQWATKRGPSRQKSPTPAPPRPLNLTPKNAHVLLATRWLQALNRAFVTTRILRSNSCSLSGEPPGRPMAYPLATLPLGEPHCSAKELRPKGGRHENNVQQAHCPLRPACVEKLRARAHGKPRSPRGAVGRAAQVLDAETDCCVLFPLV